MADARVLDLFAGPGGWSEGLRMLGLRDVGIEIDDDACATRSAAGHETVHGSVLDQNPDDYIGVEGAVFSPPCPDFSIAGSRLGRAGKSGFLIDVAPVWVNRIRPRWFACEQVPPALGVWEQHAHEYRTLGYNVWTGVLCAADFGLPQARRRAILLASLDGPALPPTPTHARNPQATLFGTPQPWKSAGSALGMDESLVIATGNNTMKTSRNPEDMVPYVKSLAEPAPTVDGKAAAAWTVGPPGHRKPPHTWKQAPRPTDEVAVGGDKIGVAGVALLQGFRDGYPFQGTQSSQGMQVGNAVPPILAAHIVATVAGIETADTLSAA